VRASTAVPETCSGARYFAVPSMVPSVVWSASVSLAIPKSATITRSSSQRRMLAGLMSRCTRPARWAVAKASATRAPMVTASGAGSVPLSSRCVRRDTPRTSSMTMASSPSLLWVS